MKLVFPLVGDLFPDLLSIYMADIPKTSNAVLAAYAGDTAILV